MCFKSKHIVNRFADQNVEVGSTKLKINFKIKNTTITFDQTLSMQVHVNTIDKNRFITGIETIQLANALLTSLASRRVIC